MKATKNLINSWVGVPIRLRTLGLKNSSVIPQKRPLVNDSLANLKSMFCLVIFALVLLVGCTNDDLLAPSSLTNLDERIDFTNGMSILDAKLAYESYINGIYGDDTQWAIDYIEVNWDLVEQRNVDLVVAPCYHIVPPTRVGYTRFAVRELDDGTLDPFF